MQAPLGKPIDKYSVKILTSNRQSDIDQQQNVLKKREEFAISLRKKKHSEMIVSKRKFNMNKAFERTIHAQATGRDPN